MYTPLEALYTYATERGDLTHWFFNQDIADTYHQALQHTFEQKDALLDQLSQEDKPRFQTYLDNAEESRSLESEMLFYQGLAMGLQLGSMVCLV